MRTYTQRELLGQIPWQEISSAWRQGVLTGVIAGTLTSLFYVLGHLHLIRALTEQEPGPSEVRIVKAISAILGVGVSWMVLHYHPAYRRIRKVTGTDIAARVDWKGSGISAARRVWLQAHEEAGLVATPE